MNATTSKVFEKIREAANSKTSKDVLMAKATMKEVYSDATETDSSLHKLYLTFTEGQKMTVTEGTLIEGGTVIPYYRVLDFENYHYDESVPWSQKETIIL